MPELANLVRVASSTTGTGTVTLGSAITGFLTPSQAGMINGVVYSYAIEADYATVGDDSVPTSREVGRGTYDSGGGTLTRTVLNSTNSNALLNLAGDAQVTICPTTESARIVLLAARTYYVRTDGSDSNNGLADSSGGAFLTIQKAINVVASTLDLAGFDVTIQVRSGTYSAAVVSKTFVSGGGIVIVQGDTSTPANVIISAGANTAIYNNHGLGCRYRWTGFRLTASASQVLVYSDASYAEIGVMEYQAVTTGTHIYCEHQGVIRLISNYTINGGTNYHYYCDSAGIIQFSSLTVTVSGTPAFSTFARADNGGGIYTFSMTYSGAATGTRYSASMNAWINTFGGGASYFPGNVAGSTATGGQYA